jgi:hypothetical protein
MKSPPLPTFISWAVIAGIVAFVVADYVRW